MNKKTAPIPAIERLHELFIYEPDTGFLKRRVACNGQAEHSIAGYLCSGYLRVRIDGRQVFVHRIAFALMTERWPFTVDHINHNRADNRWANLREVNYSQNATNRAAKGASFSKRRKKWRSAVVKDGKYFWLGYFKNEQEARDAYLKKTEELHGEFAYPA